MSDWLRWSANSRESEPVSDRGRSAAAGGAGNHESVAIARRGIELAALSLLLLLAMSAGARHYVVDPSHPGADDRNPGTPAQPIGTLDAALRRLQVGDTIAWRQGGREITLSAVRSGAVEMSTPDGAPIHQDGDVPTEGPSEPWVQRVVARVSGFARANPIPLAAIGALLLYFLVVVPAIRRRPLVHAVRIIERDEQDRFAEAEGLLQRVQTRGLWRRDVAMARFALAYVRARLRRYTEAGAILDDLIASGNRQPEVGYLRLWLHSQQDDCAGVERTYDEYGEALGDLLDTKLMAGLAFLNMAKRLWARRQVSGALSYYERLRELNVLEDQIPADLQSHKIFFGITALFERNSADAVRHFASAVETARKHGAATASARLGVLLCKWGEHDLQGFDEELGEVTDDLDASVMVRINCPECEQVQSVEKTYIGKHVACRSCRQEFSVEEQLCAESETSGQSGSGTAQAIAPDGELRERDLLRRNAFLWHAVSLLMTWLLTKGPRTLDPEERTELDKRLTRVSDVDPKMGDPHLIRGLIAYYFSGEREAEKSAALEELTAAKELEVHLPEVLDLIEREQRLSELERNYMQRFLTLLRSYLSEERVPREVRERVRLRLAKYWRARELAEIAISEEDSDAPSVHDLMTRAELLQGRLGRILKRLLTETNEEDREAVEGRLDHLRESAESLRMASKEVEAAEIEAVAGVGPLIFRDEEVPVVRGFPIDRLNLVVAAPAEIRPGDEFSLQIWVHEEGQRETIRELASQEPKIDCMGRDEGTEEEPSEEPSGAKSPEIPPPVAVRVEIPGGTPGPIDLPLQWIGKQAATSVKLLLPRSIRTRDLPGVARLLVAGAPVSEVRFSLALGKRTGEIGLLRGEQFRRHRVHACFSEADLEKVKARIDTIRESVPALEIVTKMISDETEAGWRESLSNVLADCDGCFLFWSMAARYSERVHTEYRTILQLRDRDFIDVVMLEESEDLSLPDLDGHAAAGAGRNSNS